MERLERDTAGRSNSDQLMRRAEVDCTSIIHAMLVIIAV